MRRFFPILPTTPLEASFTLQPKRLGKFSPPLSFFYFLQPSSKYDVNSNHWKAAGFGKNPFPDVVFGSVDCLSATTRSQSLCLIPTVCPYVLFLHSIHKTTLLGRRSKWTRGRDFDLKRVNQFEAILIKSCESRRFTKKGMKNHELFSWSWFAL